MADSILKLKVDSQEYDAKLKQATTGLTRYVDGCRKVGGTLEVVEKETLEYVRAVGRMETTSRSATGKLGEMKKAFVELSAQYKQMTDQEKQSPMGKAMAESLAQLKVRIGENKTQLDDINKSISGGNGLSGALDAVAGKFGLSVDQISRFGGAIGLATAAAKVAKDAFYANEAAVDEWGRTVEGTKGAYEGFLNAINNGDISGYLSRIQQIVSAARAAYDEMDRLGTMKTIQGPAISAQQTENERMRMMLQTRRYIAPIDGRKASMTNGQLLTDAQMKTVERQLNNGVQKIAKLIGNEVKQASRSIEADYKATALKNGISLGDFRKGTSSMAEFDKRIAGANQYEAFEDKRYKFVYNPQTGGQDQPFRDMKNPFEQFKGWSTFRVDGEAFNNLVQKIRDRDAQASQAYGMQSQAFRAINRVEGITARGGAGGSGGSGGGKTDPTLTNSIQVAFENAMAKASANAASLKAPEPTGPSAAYTAYAASMASDFETAEAPLVKLNRELAELQENLENAPDTSSYLLGLQAIADKQEEINEFKGVKKVEKDVNAIGESAKIAGNMIGVIGQAFNSIEDPAAKVMGTVAQAIASVALAYADTLAKDQTTKSNIWAFIAAAAAATISMVTTISSIHSATGYAEGGLIPGNSYSGDQMPAMVNSGELILNRAQQGNIASQLQEGGRQPRLVARLKGSDILVSVERTLGSQGKGQLMTFK